MILLKNFINKFFVVMNTLLSLCIKLLKKGLLFLIGAAFINWVFFNRFIRERIPTKIPKFDTIYQWNFGVYFIIFIFMSSLFFLLVLLILKPDIFVLSKTSIRDKNSDLETFKQLLIDIQQIFIKSLREVHLWFGNLIPNYLRGVLFFVKQFCKLKDYYIFILILFIYLPTIIVSLTFCVDVIHFHKFEYFYKSLILLIFPTILHTVIGIFRHAYDLNNKSLVEVYFTSNHEDLQNFVIDGKTYEESIKDYFQVKSFEEFRKAFYEPMEKIPYAILEPIDNLISQYSRKVFAFVIFFYSIGWGYIVFHSFLN